MKKKALLLILLVSFITTANSQNTRVEKWEEDLNFYRETLEEKHIDLYHTISKEEFKLELQKIKIKLPELSDFKIITEL
ncbi:MAG: hypothetical protein KUG68_04615, partial [Flavobacteriaceae bacterium]|nr:hypothetical protein [Flavobacteriaceae bacterium]